MKSLGFAGVVVGSAVLVACVGGASRGSSGGGGKASPGADGSAAYELPRAEQGEGPYAEPAPASADEGEAQTTAPQPPSAPGDYAAPRAESATGESKGLGSGRSAAAPKASRGSNAYDQEPSRSRAPREERPGLGTSWGESRASHVTTVPFVRAQHDRPFAVAKLFYNDAEGIRAMASHTGAPDYGAGTLRIGGGAVTVRLLNAYGEPLPALDVAGRTHFEGSHGDRYTIELQNHTGTRVEAVASVDGLDVIDGRSASPSKRGYILDAYQTVEIDGFRRSTDEVAAFRFGSVRSSYAARKGSDRNVGVIGVALFNEAGTRYPWTHSELQRRNSADPFPGRFATPPRPVFYNE